MSNHIKFIVMGILLFGCGSMIAPATDASSDAPSSDAANAADVSDASVSDAPSCAEAGGTCRQVYQAQCMGGGASMGTFDCAPGYGCCSP